MNEKGTATLEKFKNILRVKNYSLRTIENYSCYAERFLANTTTLTYNLTHKELNSYLLDFPYTSISQQNQIINSLKLFYKFILGKEDIHLSKIQRPRKEKKLPRVVSHEEILQVIKSISNIKHRTIITLAYSTGLRVSEVCNLKLENIVSKRMIIIVQSGKGRKDRIVPLSQELLEQLRQYYKLYKPQTYLFESYKAGKKYSSSSCRAVWNKYKLDSNATFHSLRHSCFTHLLETGTDMRIIQKIAGHNSIKTTEGYAHVSTNLLNKVKMPI